MDVQNILSTIDLAELRNHIIQTSIVAWKNYITESSLDRWLKNFDGAALGNAVVEQTIAAWLLLNFTYYTDTEVRELCKIIYRKFIHRKLQEEYYQRSSEDVQTKIQRILTRTIFLPLGNPSESGALILYLAFKLCNYYGTEIVSHELSAAEAYMKSHPLGFADGQHLFGFYYNTPDNTLPIFWCKSPNWSPAFVRYGKVYGIEGVCISDEQYW